MILKISMYINCIHLLAFCFIEMLQKNKTKTKNPACPVGTMYSWNQELLVWLLLLLLSVSLSLFFVQIVFLKLIQDSMATPKLLH